MACSHSSALTPDEPLIPVAYARLAGRLAPGAVTALELAPGSVTAEKIAPGSVLSHLLSDGAGTVQISTSPTNAALLEAGLVPVGSTSVRGASWTRKVFDVPPARSNPRAYWSGSELVVIGGTTTDTTSTPLAGFRYSPRTGGFAPLPTNNAPVFPSGAGSTDLSAWSSTWTGDALLVWNSVSRFGRRADPRGTTWTALSNQDAPLGTHPSNNGMDRPGMGDLGRVSQRDQPG
jgi:hypothetical protein